VGKDTVGTRDEKSIIDATIILQVNSLHLLPDVESDTK
jgi:hypothetical protein